MKFVQKVIRVPKKEAAFTYFILESHEGLCFYSTLEESLGTGYRDIDIKCTPEFNDELMYVLNYLSSKLPLDILKTTIQD